MRYSAAAALFFCSLLVTGCGLRGPLYLPEDEARTQETARPSPEEDEEDKDPVGVQPAPQAQKRDRTATGDTAVPAN